MFWPSFNSVLVDNPERKLGAVCSTYLALAVGAVTAAALSVLSSPKGKLNPVHLTFNMLTHNYALSCIESVMAGVEGLVPVLSPRHQCASYQWSQIYNGAYVFTPPLDPHAVFDPCWWCCCRGFHVSCSSTVGSHGNRIHCCCCINYWIQISQGFDPYMKTFNPLIK